MLTGYAISGNAQPNVSFSVNTSLLTGSGNTAIGKWTLSTTPSTIYNTVIGNNSMTINKSGNYNTATGFESMSDNYTAGYNTANGYQSLYRNPGGDVE